MQAHAHALASSGVDVDMVGCEARRSREIPDLRPAHHRASPWASRACGTAQAIRKIAFGLLADIRCRARQLPPRVGAVRIPKPDLLLVQNPPSIPTLRCRGSPRGLRRARLVIDWHNLGYTILALRLGRRHVAVRLARWIEMVGGRMADAHLCVSRGFARIPGGPVRSEGFAHASGAGFIRSSCGCIYADQSASSREQIRRGTFSSGSASGTPAPSASLCARTSWTADEDFDLVIDAVRELEDRIRGWEAGRARGGSRAGHSVTGRASAAPSSNGGLPDCPRDACSCTRWPSPRTTRKSSAARIWASVSTDHRRVWTFR